MPIYPFKCKKCQRIWERFLNVDVPKFDKCPLCGTENERQYQAVNAKVAGSDFNSIMNDSFSGQRKMDKGFYDRNVKGKTNNPINGNDWSVK